MHTISLIDLVSEDKATVSLLVADGSREHYNIDGIHIIRDYQVNINCFFIRIAPNYEFNFSFLGLYNIIETKAGGYIGQSVKNGLCFWIPEAPISRNINHYNQILHEDIEKPSGFLCNNENTILTLKSKTGLVLDFIVLIIDDEATINHLDSQIAIENTGFFLNGSHTKISKFSDLYHHLIHGFVYDLRYSWPNHKKCFSENEAHALYCVYSGLEKTSGKSIYRFFQVQLVLSIINRQSLDGGWYHGMWTDDSECHYRLHTSGIHLLMDEFDRTQCPTVRQHLEKAVAFLVKNAHQLNCGLWFLHDSLELSEQAMNSGPFLWIPSRVLGKQSSNMLVLNTHLDTTIALNRYSKLTGDQQYDSLISSALESTRTVLALKPAEWLYKPLFWAIGLTMLPTQIARRLPLPLRAIKRLAVNVLIPLLPDIKAKFPRLVMPNGYIDRELSLRTWAIDYQTINLMDLARYARAFPGALDEHILDKALAFTHDSGLIERYQELPDNKRYAPGFWMEALYHRCLAKSDSIYRQWLAEAILQCHASGLGLAPSLLGANGEAVGFDDQVRMPLVDLPEILMANLSHDQHIEFLLVNSSQNSISIPWHKQAWMALSWQDAQGKPLSSDTLVIEGHRWLIGKRA